MLQRVDIRAACDVLLQDVILHRARELALQTARTPGRRDIHGQKNGRRRIDGHRGRNGVQRDAGKKPLHIFDRIDRDSGLTDLARRPGGVRVVANLGGQVECHREPVAALGQQKLIAAVGLFRVAHPGVLPHRPQAASVHGGPDPPGKGVLARIAKIAFGVETGQVLRTVEGPIHDLRTSCVMWLNGTAPRRYINTTE